MSSEEDRCCIDCALMLKLGGVPTGKVYLCTAQLNSGVIVSRSLLTIILLIDSIGLKGRGWREVALSVADAVAPALTKGFAGSAYGLSSATRNLKWLSKFFSSKASAVDRSATARAWVATMHQ